MRRDDCRRTADALAAMFFVLVFVAWVALGWGG